MNLGIAPSFSGPVQSSPSSPLYRAGPASFGELWAGTFIKIRREEAHQLVVLGRVPPKLPRREASLGKAVEKRMRHRRMAHDLVPERLNEGRWGDLCRCHVDDPDGTATGRRTAGRASTPNVGERDYHRRSDH